MSEVFISYARSTEPQAKIVAEALRRLSYGVWRDDELPAHRSFSQVIEERLAAAKAVLVIWSADAAKSEWVQSEADRARKDGKLVQLRVDDAALPMPFDRTQCADLTVWNGDPEAPEWKKVVASIAALTGEQAPPIAPDPTLFAKPTVAVIPFSNLSNDPEQTYFVEGVVEEIVASIARYRTLNVIAASDSTIYRGERASPQDAARRLGVNFLLEGSVRKAGARVRITLHLIDAATGAQIWADRLDDSLDDIFALQDRVAERVAGVIENRVLDASEQKASARPTGNMGSYDLYLRAMPLFRLSRKPEMLQSIELLGRAVELDPAFALAQSQSAVCHRQVVDHAWSDEPEFFRARGLALAERALALARDDSKVLAQVAASLPGLEGGCDRALALLERAAALNPASSFVELVSGSVQLRNGEPDIAAEHLERAIRLDPISSMNAFARMYLASARFQQERFAEALALFRTTTLRLPVSYAVLAALHGHLGQRAQARDALAQLESREAGDIEKFARIWFPRPNYRALLLDGIACAETPTPA
ncbi:MAG TPA: TIR domain-containing protein [Caulobacteraceae bacterium]|nr:TIR domain-containing protein [Caulobacteraceae bacterium]